MNRGYFNIVTKNPDGFNHRCKVCQKLHNEEYYKNTREKQIESAKQWNKEHREWRLEYDKQRYLDNPDYFIENNKKNVQLKPEIHKPNKARWRRENTDKCKTYRLNRDAHKKHEITQKEFDECKEFFGYKCCYCEMSEEEHKKKYGEQLHKEHAYNNGSNKIDNCIPACKSCNSSKRVGDWCDWYIEDNPKYTYDRYKNIENWLNRFKQ
jgi:hypothetical protein